MDKRNRSLPIRAFCGIVEEAYAVRLGLGILYSNQRREVFRSKRLDERSKEIFVVSAISTDDEEIINDTGGDTTDRIGQRCVGWMMEEGRGFRRWGKGDRRSEEEEEVEVVEEEEKELGGWQCDFLAGEQRASSQNNNKR
ncbi:hypothetical protein B9Z55_013706 [Caenorhabditis nigoni]|uniref:Uncharacterized protein n=1 Tax=Caenorhabditis nigoni TaxID=1611254 RepID=A0A2G5U2X2_9PELO|nr:hypothetical protein B9Z55_013706 [Caenorhabditis nigoni]